MHTPLQPTAPIVEKQKLRFPGCAGAFILLLLMAAGISGYVMYRWHQTPAEAWQHLTLVVQQFVRQNFAPRPSPPPELTPTPRATPRVDAMAWLIEHKDRWPKEVILREPMEFPAVSAGKIVGSLIVPAGAGVIVTDITRSDIGATYLGGVRRVPISATDLSARAQAVLAKAELEHGRPAASLTPQIVTRKRRELEKIREATPERVHTGLGALYTLNATTFRLFAPTAKTVSVVIYSKATGADGRSVRPLQPHSNNLWDATIPGDLLGKFYTFLLDDKDMKRAREVLDPYATNSVASSTRARITPLNEAVGRGPKVDSATDAIIYEMQVRDFTIAPNSGVDKPGLYLGWTAQGTHLADDGTSGTSGQIKTALDHLSELGITHVELMPVQDFENDETSGNYNWGYITSNFFSPEGMFATNPDDDSRVRELRALVAALHQRGISVIMDVVYNHTSNNCSLMSIAPEYYYRRGANGTLANGSGCGNEFKSESPMGRRLILDSLKFWAGEYGVDGFRFDLMALIDQETMREADRELRKINPNIVLFGEPWTGGTSPLREKSDKNALRQLPAGAFNDDFRNALKGSPDGSDSGWIENGSNRDALKAAMLVSNWFASPTQSINYMTCHDNLVLWDKLVSSMPNATDALRVETMKLGYLALLTSQGVPFMHGGEEFARTKNGDNNSFESPDSVNEIDWNLKREHLDLFNYVRDLIVLRKAHPMFRLRTTADVRSRVQFVENGNRDVLMFTLNGEGVSDETWKRAWVVLNSANEKGADVILPGGEWFIATDERGAVKPSVVSGKITVRYKSGVVLYQ
jgi:pullulanase